MNSEIDCVNASFGARAHLLGASVNTDEWTTFFLKKAEANDVFGAYDKLNTGDRSSAVVVATYWYRFSETMPWVLSYAASKVSSNEQRHYIIRVAYEELGGNNPDEIHSALYLRALESAGISYRDIHNFSTTGYDETPIANLRRMLLADRSDAYVLGVGLGLEIVAYKNIETIFKSAAFETEHSAAIADSVFFRTHFINETEHIRLGVENFLRFCPLENQKLEFFDGFETAIQFWRTFWGSVANAITFEKTNRTE